MCQCPPLSPPSPGCPWFGAITAVNVLGMRSREKGNDFVAVWFMQRLLKAKLIPLHQADQTHSLKELNLEVHKSLVEDNKNTFFCFSAWTCVLTENEKCLSEKHINI